MRPTPLAVLSLMSITGFCACGSSSSENPPNLWLAPDNGETTVKLVAAAPPAY